jgi:hypothetical protein
MHAPIDHDHRLRLRITGKLEPRLGAKAPPPRRGGFIAVPYGWEYRLREAKRGAVVYPVALYILRRDWETDRAPVKVSNVAMERLGLSRQSKWRALKELEALGLIHVQEAYGKNPVVTIRVRR